MNKKIALITGANRGIGFEIAKQLVDTGFIVYILARTSAKGAAAVSLLKQEIKNRQVHHIVGDVTNQKSLVQAATTIEQKHGHLDVLINNAGILLNAGNTETVALKDIQKTFETNLYGPLLMSQVCLPLLKNSKEPRIINLSSEMGSLTNMQRGYASYRISKTALNSLTRIMSMDFPEIKVFSMCPGWVKTDMGGQHAPRSVEEGADTAVWLAQTDDAKSGYFYQDRKIIAW